jgi:hypothetical protein
LKKSILTYDSVHDSNTQIQAKQAFVACFGVFFVGLFVGLRSVASVSADNIIAFQPC